MFINNASWPSEAYWSRDAPTGLISRIVRSAHTVFMCFVFYLRTSSDLCYFQHKLIGFHNRGEKCLLRGTNWVFKYVRLSFVFKGLTVFINGPSTCRGHYLVLRKLWVFVNVNVKLEQRNFLCKIVLLFDDLTY
jgi:hypothetical protein